METRLCLSTANARQWTHEPSFPAADENVACHPSVLSIISTVMAKRKRARTGAARLAPAPSGAATRPAPRPQPSAAADPGRSLWLYGVHATLAALANPRRRVRRVLLTAETARRHGPAVAAALARRDHPAILERVPREAIAARLPEGAVHQGIAMLTTPLPALPLDAICAAAEAGAAATVVVLDQVTDPHNVGAVLRSAAALGALAVILQQRHAPADSGMLAKAASGALDHLAVVRVGNLASALDRLKRAGFRCVGLAGRAETRLAETRLDGRVALVLGSEGRGLRRLTAERCDVLVRLPTAGPIAELNVSTAAAVALYEAARQRDAG
jgi:23S rRNA (guanosine2251-2'-O)-methyltransferase